VKEEGFLVFLQFFIQRKYTAVVFVGYNC